MVTINELIGKNVRDRRKASGLSQKGLAKNAGLSESTIVRLERGQQPPRRSNLMAIARELGCSVEDLYKADDETTGRASIKSAVKEALAEDSEFKIKTEDEFKLLAAYRRATILRRAEVMATATDDPADAQAYKDLKRSLISEGREVREAAEARAQANEETQASARKPRRR